MLFITLFRGFATRGPIFTRNLRLQIDCKRLRAILVSTEGNPLIEDARIPGIDTVVLPLVSELTSRNRRLLSATVGEKLRSLGNPIRGGKLKNPVQPECLGSRLAIRRLPLRVPGGG